MGKTKLRQKIGTRLVGLGLKIVQTGDLLSNEGVGGVARRVGRRLLGRGRGAVPDNPIGRPREASPFGSEVVTPENYSRFLEIPEGAIDRHSHLGEATYRELLAAFDEKLRAAGHTEYVRCSWYHTVDASEEFTTPGLFDYRRTLDEFHFPDDMTGMLVLDVGSATGFFAFEFERRGAEVVSVDLPSIADWDMPAGPDKEQTLRELMERYGTDSVDELSHRFVHGPFEFCHKLRGSKVRRVKSRVYDLTLEKVGGRTFDFAFVGDLLEHTFSPLMALSAIGNLVHGTLVLYSMYPREIEHRPVMFYAGSDHRRADNRTWWYPSRTCLEQMLRRIGFNTIEKVHNFEGRIHQDIHHGMYDKVILHARK